MHVGHSALKMTSLADEPAPAAARGEAAGWLERFHAGDRAVIEQIYRDHFARVGRTTGSLLGAADGETATHEVFFRLLTVPALRASFRSGELGAWLVVVARNHAIDYRRRQGREIPTGSSALMDVGIRDSAHARSEARLLLERFRTEVLPPEWAGVFEARFLREMSQSEAARHLGMGRTTLAYQEIRLRRLLRRFVLGGPR